MSEENKQEAEQAETENREGDSSTPAEGEKKEGKISGFFKKLGKKIDDATYSSRMHSAFNDSHPKYTVYGGTGILESNPEIAVEEHLDEGYLVTIEDYEKIAAGNLIKTPKGDILHIAATEQTSINFDFEEKSNEIAAIKIILGNAAQEVNVIKVGDKFYLA